MMKILRLGLAFCVTSGLLITTPAIAETPADNYKLFCVQCHGTNMSGEGINARQLSVEPRNHKSAEDMGSLSDEDLELAIRKGGVAVGKSSQMPPFGALLTEQELDDMVRYLREACNCAYK